MTRQPSPDLARRAVDLGRQLRAARERAGLTCTAAAAALGPGGDADALDAIERGMLAPSLQQLYALVDHYGATVDVCVWPQVKAKAAPIRRTA